ncbi:MAG: CapA family protein [Sandaracinaceae bacterium]|nr:CapA family protein [Sandaracinaceae bacterium]
MPSARRAVRAIHRAALLLALGCLAAAVARGRAQPAAARRVVIGASGDVLFHTRVVASARASGGFDHTLSGLRSIVTDAEIAFANLETPLSTEHAPMRGDPPRLGAPPEAAGALARAGIDVLSVANNHAWDQRAEGLVETVAALEAAGIASVGAAPDEEDAPGPIVIERAGVRVAFVAFTDVLQGHPGTRRPPLRVATWDERRARRALERARARADLVVASMHWGLGYRHDDRSEQRSAAAALVRHGADLVLGHGPHVLQRVERVSSPRGEALVVYSLGNLVSNQGYLYRRGVRERSAELPLREPATRDGVWLRAGLELRDGRVAIGGVEAIPLWTHNNHWDVERRRVPPDVRVLPHRDVDDDALRAERRAAIEAVLGPVVNLL